MTIQEDIQRAIKVLIEGGVILYPTDTVWGIGCDATSGEAVRRVFEIKQRPESKALISLVGSERMLEQVLGSPVPDAARECIESTERPVTVVYGHVAGLAPELLAPDGSAGIRLTHEKFSSMLCEAFGRPLVSTSANISGNPAPAVYDEIPSDIIDKMDYIISYRRDDNSVALPSKVVKINADATITILRP